MTIQKRDFIGYGENKPKVTWKNNAKVAINFVLNYEEGAENCILNGDTESECYLSEIFGVPPLPGARNIILESGYEYGSRAGVWRILDLFKDRQIPFTMYAAGMAMEMNPKAIERTFADGHEICSHNYRWIDYNTVPIDTEREHIQKCIDIQKQITGERPVGMYTGRYSANTRKLLVEDGGFLYDSDDYSDDLPFWNTDYDSPLLIVPYSLVANDFKFLQPFGFANGEQFYQHLKDTFDTLYAEGTTCPKILNIGLHARIIGHPGRFQGLKKFIDYILQFDDIWITRRDEIAKTWIQQFPHK